jgi:hypothetical protein
VLEEFFFDGVAVEPGDGAQPPGDGRPGPAPGFQLSGEAFDVGAANGEQIQGAGAAASERAPEPSGHPRNAPYRRFGVNGDRALVADRRALNVQFCFMLQMAYLSEEDGSAGR